VGIQKGLTQNARILGCDKATTKKYIDAYFEYVYFLPYCRFLHRASFLKNWTQGVLNTFLLKAVCAASARFVGDDNETKRKSTEWAEDAEKFALQQLGTPSVILVEVLMVIIFQATASRQLIKAQVLAALAVRLAYILRLNRENESLSVATRESRRRLMWAIFSLDGMYAGGMTELALCRAETIYIQLPCHERAFALDIAEKTEQLRNPGNPRPEGNSKMGILAYLLRICDIRHRILWYEI
jgi:hypothetical protein